MESSVGVKPPITRDGHKTPAFLARKVLKSLNLCINSHVILIGLRASTEQRGVFFFIVIDCISYHLQIIVKFPLWHSDPFTLGIFQQLVSGK